MKFRQWTILLACTLFLFASSNKNPNAAEESTVKLQGTGASFPAPLYTKWFKSFGSNRKGTLVDYQSVGSAAA
jgi:phosphate transport system substrate-binding protein